MSQSPVLTYRQNTAAQTSGRSRGKSLEIPPNQSNSASFGGRRQARGGGFAWGWLRTLMSRTNAGNSREQGASRCRSGNKIPETGQ